LDEKDKSSGNRYDFLHINGLPVSPAKAIPKAFYFWQFVSLRVTGWLVIRLRAVRQEIAKNASVREP
jgi:hypothetical protein